jgi:hypothetical protein
MTLLAYKCQKGHVCLVSKAIEEDDRFRAAA